MGKSYIRLRGVGGPVDGRRWESDTMLRVGRQDSLEVVILDPSVSRTHAEIRATDTGWHLRDLGSTNGTFINRVRLTAESPLRERDVIQFGKVPVEVEKVEGETRRNGRTDHVVVEASTRCSWEQALDGIAYDRRRSPRPEQQLLALLRASYHLGHLAGEEDLLRSILRDAVSTLDAQRGAIVLADDPGGELRVGAVVGRNGEGATRFAFSQTLAQRAFSVGESILCCQAGEDPELAIARSIAKGEMASVLCVLLRTPRKHLGVLHLDRGYQQKPFTEDDLHLADALAASVSAGIESAQLMRTQRELFLNTITALAHAIDMRDPYTGNHTYRVTRYAELLGRNLSLSAEELDLLRVVTPLHDIGKIGIDDAILRKPGRLTPEEFEVMKTHTTKGAAILATVEDLGPGIPVVRSHHERWDGAGYPDGLAGKAIPRLARIVSVADAFDAMTSDRPYRKGMPAEVAFAEVQKQSGKQFDPNSAAAFLTIRDQIVQEMHKQNGTDSDLLGASYVTVRPAPLARLAPSTS